MNVRRERVAVGVVDEVLEQHAADALHHAAGDLAFDDVRVDHVPAVLRHDVALQHGDIQCRGRSRPRRRARRSTTWGTASGGSATVASSPLVELGRAASSAFDVRDACATSLIGHRLRSACPAPTRRCRRSRGRPATASITCAATAAPSRAPRRSRRARRRRRSTAVRLPPVPGPYGVDCVSACTTVTSSYADAEVLGDDLGHRGLHALAVRRGAEEAITRPLDSIRTVAPSVATWRRPSTWVPRTH